MLVLRMHTPGDGAAQMCSFINDGNKKGAHQESAVFYVSAGEIATYIKYQQSIIASRQPVARGNRAFTESRWPLQSGA